MDRIDEQSRRTPGFVEGTPVVGADGQPWNLPRPYIVFDLDDTETGFVARMQMEGDDGELSRLTKAWEAAQDAAVGREIIMADLKLRSFLVRRNYDLSAAEMNEIFPYVYDADHPLDRIRREVVAVARGEGPKSGSGGDESPPTAGE